MQYGFCDNAGGRPGLAVGHLSIRKAAIEFDVPKTTLHDTLKEKYQDAGMPGRKPALPVNIENRIANALKEASRQGMGVSPL
jgi:hypothetical protein